MLYDLQYVPKEHGKLLRGMKENESFKDYIARNESILDAMGMTATARRAYITQKSPDAGLTSYELLTNKSPKQAKQVADTYIKVEYDLMRQAKENKENTTLLTDEIIEKTQKWLEWVRDVNKNGIYWSINPPSRFELYPNMKRDSGKWNDAKNHNLSPGEQINKATLLFTKIEDEKINDQIAKLKS